MLIGGIDEAGRGPVMGPMVMAIAVVKKEDEFKLQTMGIKDSKLLSPARRIQLFEVVSDLCETAVVQVSPEEIDIAVESETDNLNWLEARKAAELVNKVKADSVIFDCPSNNLEAYSKYIQNKVLDKKMKLIVEHKADLNHIIVGAASIIAKVTRDQEIANIRKKIGDFGSGYSSDPKAQAFVKKYWADKTKSKYMRKSWDTWKRCQKMLSQKSLGDF